MKAMVFNLQWLTLDCFYSFTKIFLQNTLFPILGPLGKVHLEADALFLDTIRMQPHYHYFHFIAFKLHLL